MGCCYCVNCCWQPLPGVACPLVGCAVSCVLCVVCLGSNKDPAVVRCMGRRITSGPDSVCFLADATILKAMQLAIRISTYSVRKLILLYTAMYNWMIIHKWTENIFVLFLVLSSD